MALDVRDARVGQVVSGGAQSAPRARCLPSAEHGLIGDSSHPPTAWPALLVLDPLVRGSGDRIELREEVA